MIVRRLLHSVARLGMVTCAVAALTGCETINGTLPPQISVANIELTQPGLLRQDFNLDLRIANPNNVDIPLEGLTFHLDVDGQPFADGLSNERVTVPRLSEISLPVKASTDTFSLVRQILTLGQRDKISYRITGFAYVSGFTGARRVPYERKGSLSLLPVAPHDGGAPPKGAPGAGMRELAPM